MTIRNRLSILLLSSLLLLPLSLSIPTQAQQTLGGITGAVTDESGAAVPDATITVVGDQTALTRSTKTDATGAYTFVNLPIGTYTLTFSHASFETQKIPSITVQANRTATLNASLKVGAVSTTVTVEETPLVNAVDTTNGYVLDKVQMEAVPLPTGSFTGLAILSPGVNAELPAGTGANAGLGNQAIWANGQRDTSNTFLLNGVDASNLFNGKTTSQVASARIVNNTGVAGASSTTAEVIQSTASPYLAIGQALPTPAPETIQELRVNTSMYDAQQGSTSGAHIDMSTASGTNDFHGQAYIHRGTDWLNAAPYFYKQDDNIPAADKVPELHRYSAGGTFGGPIIKNKIFGFAAYQHVHASDLEIGTSRTAVPFGLTDDRSPAALAAAANDNFFSSVNATVGTGPNDINPIAYGLLNYKLPDGQYLIPSANNSFTPTINFPENVFITQPAYFIADQAAANLDILATSRDTLALKYYYQHDPSTAPFGYSSIRGFTQKLDAGSQVATITNTQTLTPNFNLAEVFGFIREKAYSTIGQPFTPAGLQSFIEGLDLPGVNPGDALINTFNSPIFPGMTIVDDLGNFSPNNTGNCENEPNQAFAVCGSPFNAGLAIGMTAASQGAFTGVFQNRWMPSASAIWIKGRHTVTFGGSFSYTQLNARDRRTNTGMIGFTDFPSFLEGTPISYTADGFIATTFLQGDANRYYRSRETGEYIQDKFQIRPNLSVSVGLRFDYHGGMTEKNGRLYNFDPALYNYDQDTDTIVSNGFIVASNNPLFPTKGVSPSTLTGRQWGLAPRIGVAWSPKMFNNKLVVRAGWGIYYDRGELFTYLSPGFASGVIAGGPFGVNQSPPWVASQQCDIFGYTLCEGGFSNPWGESLGPAPSGNPADLFIPTAGDIEEGIPLFSFAVYNRKNKLPYTLNQTLDIQWQPRNDLAIEVGYVGNFGRHEVIPVPFNQARIATPANPLCGPAPVCPDPETAVAPQSYTYGYSIVDAPGSFNTIQLPDGTFYQENFEGGNVDLRVPYIGYSSESESYTAAGISAYHALQTHIEKRMSHGVQVGFSYTYSHALDEQSAMGLFYNGNNPLDLHSAYGNSDFDRTHVFNVSYLFRLHDFYPASSWQGKFTDGWALSGTAVFQSGQPYSIIDYSGAVGSIFYGVNDGITNPVVPLAPGCTPKSAVTGFSGVDQPSLNADCFTLPILAPNDLNGAIPANDPYETGFIDRGQRNIFRQPWQKRADISIMKSTQLTEKVALKYSLDIFNVTNTASFDIPIDDVTQNINFNGFPYQGQAGATTPCNTDFSALYVCPSLSGLGVTNKTIGSPRQIQMSLSVVF
ncbi:MAG TPA: TonB-dependent receptor [Verrucomicrobiae bacterium]|nr:TonB-dependent receptor [Verrucomicrobiae bacterium]